MNETFEMCNVVRILDDAINLTSEGEIDTVLGICCGNYYMNPLTQIRTDRPLIIIESTHPDIKGLDLMCPNFECKDPFASLVKQGLKFAFEEVLQDEVSFKKYNPGKAHLLVYEVVEGIIASRNLSLSIRINSFDPKVLRMYQFS